MFDVISMLDKIFTDLKKIDYIQNFTYYFTFQISSNFQ